MAKAKIKIEVKGNAVHADVEGMTFDVLAGLLEVLTMELNDCRMPGVTNEQLASDMRNEILARLNRMSESNAN